MRAAKRKHLEARGWKIGSVEDFLGLSDQEFAYIDLRLKLARAVTDVLAVDESLARQLAPLPGFRPVDAAGPRDTRFANHCPHCGVEQDDRDLHSEPKDPFFDIPHAAPGAIRLSPLLGEVRLSGDEHFAIE